MMKLFKFFSFFYLISLTLFLLFLNHTKNAQIILLFQLIIGIYLITVKKYKLTVLLLIFLFFVEFIFIRSNIFYKHYDALEFNEKDLIIYEPLSIIKYLYVKKYKPININNQKLIPLTNLKNSKIYNGRVGNYLTYNITDEIGFFNESNNSDYQYIFLGDSFLNFAEIEKEKSFINLLESKNIYNMSLANSGPLSQLALIKEFIDLPKFKNINKVIWFHSEENDIARPYIEYENKGGDLNIEYSLTLLKQYLNHSEFKQNISNNIDSINSKLKKNKYVTTYENNVDKKRNFFLINFFSNSFYYLRKLTIKPKKELIRSYEESESFYKNQIQIMSKTSSSMKKILDERNIQLLVVILPNKFNCRINKDHFLNNKIVKKLNENKIKNISAKKAFIKNNECNLDNFNRFGHFSVLGHKNMSLFLQNKIFK